MTHKPLPVRKFVALYLYRAWILGAVCFCTSAQGQEVDAAYNYLQGRWGADAHSDHRGPFGFEIRGRRLRVPDYIECEWLPFHVLADVTTNENGNTFHRISIAILYLGRHKHACIKLPIMMWSFRVPPLKGPTGQDLFYAGVDFYTSRSNWDSRDSVQYNGFTHMGMPPIYPAKAADDILGGQTDH